MNKRGIEKYYFLISLIVGIVIIGLVGYFIFSTSIGSKEVSYQVCKQSVFLRSLKIDEGGLAENKIKSLFPFKCKTDVVNVRAGDNITKVIADEMVNCWSLYGEGKERLYGSDWVNPDTSCFICARIHLSSDIVSRNQIIFQGRYLSGNEYSSGVNYLDYLFGKIPDAYLSPLKDAVGRTMFLPENGDVFVVFEYTKSVGNFASGEVHPYSQYVALFQGKDSTSFTSKCDVIETIPE